MIELACGLRLYCHHIVLPTKYKRMKLRESTWKIARIMKQGSTVVGDCLCCEVGEYCSEKLSSLSSRRAGEYCSEKLFFVKQESTVVKNCFLCQAGEYFSEKLFWL